MSKALRTVSFVLGAAAILGVGYLQWQGRARAPETAQKVDFQPAEGVLVDRLRFQMVKDFGEGSISTTLPVSATMQAIPFAQGFVAPQAHGHGGEFSDDTDAGQPVATTPTDGAYLVRFSNSQLCDANGACPIVLAPKAAGAELVQNALMQISAKTIWVSSRATNGNPDLIVDYGVPGMAPVRMAWSLDGQFPVYDIVPSSSLPELK